MHNTGYSLTDLQRVSMTFLGRSVNGLFYSFCLEFITNFECFYIFSNLSLSAVKNYVREFQR